MDSAQVDAALTAFIRDLRSSKTLSHQLCKSICSLAAPDDPSKPVRLSDDLFLEPGACTALRKAFVTRHLPRRALLRRLLAFSDDASASRRLHLVLDAIIDASTPGAAALEVFLSLRSFLTEGKADLPSRAAPLLVSSLVRQWRQRDLLSSLMTGAPLHDRDVCEACTALASLPTVVANALSGEVPLELRSRAFLAFVAPRLLPVSTSSNRSFAGRLLGRFCLAGYGAQLWRHLLTLPEAQQRGLADLLAEFVPPEHLHVTLMKLLEAEPPMPTLQRLLAGVDRDRLAKVLELVVLRSQRGLGARGAAVARQVLAFLGATWPALLRQLFKVLLVQWTTRHAVEGPAACYETHEAVSAALVTAHHYLADSGAPLGEEERSEAVGRLLPGISLHLGATTSEMRRLGMVVAELLMAAPPRGLGLAPSGADGEVRELNFDCEEDEVSRALRLLANGQEPVVPSSLGSDSEEDEVVVVQEGPIETQEKEEEKVAEEALDSDDYDEPEEAEDGQKEKFESFDLSGDLPKSGAPAPKYLRDCLEGLRSSRPEEAERLASCLAAGERLVLAHPSAAREAAPELLRALLHLAPDCPDPAAAARRRVSMMAALAEVAPKEMAPLMTGAFYEPNLSIPQRLDLLAAISEAAQRLAAPPTRPLERRQTVGAVLAPNCRRFAGPRPPPLPSAPSRFAPVAGAFFFPLMAGFDRAVGVLDLRRDLILLAHLLLTLAALLACADSAPGLGAMQAAMVELLGDGGLQRHSDPSVRRAALSGLSAAFGTGTVPLSQLRPDLAPRLMDTRLWLGQRAREDPDPECRQLASWALSLLRSRCLEF